MLQLLAEAEPRKKARVYRQLGWLCHATRQRSDQSPLGHLHMAVGADADAEHFMGVVFFGRPAKPTATMDVPARKKGAAVVSTTA